MSRQVPYSYQTNEEIARWCVEVFFKVTETKLGWWIAFTNPTAGPWKKITTKTTDNKNLEIYRFGQTEDRPDLVVVNDELEVILIVEAKDGHRKLLDVTQMKKSVKVMNDIAAVLRSVQLPAWARRRSYRIVPAFLWFSEEKAGAVNEDVIVTKFFKKNSGVKPEEPMNIVIVESGEKLEPIFIFRGRPSKIPELRVKP